MSKTTWLAHSPFASTRTERAALARSRFFEDGTRPTGLVNEAVVQSWQRCMTEHRAPGERLSLDTISRLRLDTALRRTRTLREAASNELALLERALASTHCAILLLDGQGMIVHASASGEPSRQMRALARPGVDASERALGTSAPSLVLHTGQPSELDAGEHFFEQISVLRCAAAPIRDIHGQIAGVLNLTVEHRGFGFEPSALVGLHAAAMERALLKAQSRHQTVVEMHVHPQALGAPGAGLLGIDDSGHIAWFDAAAKHFTGARTGAEALPCEAVLGVTHGALLNLAAREMPMPHALPNGLSVWMRASAPANLLPAPEQQPREQAPAVAPPARPSLAEQDRALILQTLRDCGDNVSAAARRLGISRGRVYRCITPSDPSTST